MNHYKTISELFLRDSKKMAILNIVKSIELPDWIIAAGFVRNTIWNWQFETNERLNDIDVIYFCDKDISEKRDIMFEMNLLKIEPRLPWSVKNQARMHIKNGDQSYLNSLDAMSYWPEKQTALGVKLTHNEVFKISHCFDLSLQFNHKVTHNPKRSKSIFLSRVKNKNWLEKWPALSVD